MKNTNLKKKNSLGKIIGMKIPDYFINLILRKYDMKIQSMRK